jgi:hypothetical protein
MARRRIYMTEVQEVLHQWSQGRSERSIAKSLNMSRNTVRQILKQAKLVGLSPESEQKNFDEAANSLLKLREEQSTRNNPAQNHIKEQHDQIAAWLSMPYMTVNQMVRLFAEQNKKISEMSLRRYIKKHFPSLSVTTTMHLEVLPGNQAQVDFCYVGRMKDPLSGKTPKAYAFIVTLSFSRYRFVRFVFRQDIKTWIDCHIRAFHFFGGVPHTMLLDNLKAGVLLAEIYDPTINRSYAELERHYQFIADPTKVRTPEHKGKVERSVQIVRQQILAGRTFEDIEKANEYALKWCRDEIAHKVTRTTGKTPWELFNQIEKSTLKALPATDYECPVWQKAKAHRDHHLVFEGSFYSVPCQYVGKDVWVRATQRMVDVYYEEKKIKTHIRAHAKGQWTTDKQDYPKQTQSFLEKDAAHCLKEAKAIGAFVYELMEKTLERGSITNQRKAQAILRLAEKYDKDRFDGACKRLLRFENTRYKSLQRILEQGIDQEEKEENPNHAVSASLKNGSYLRNLREFSDSYQEEASL